MPWNETITAIAEARTGLVENPMTAAGDIIVGGVSGAPAKLVKGTDGHVLTLASGTPAWQAASGGGVDIGQIYALNA